jgi:exported serine protease, subtilase family
LWQAAPNTCAKDLIEVIRQTSNNHLTPNNIMGYGVPDFMEAYHQVVLPNGK